MVVVALRGRLAFVGASIIEGGEEGDAWAPLNGCHMSGVGSVVRTQAWREAKGGRGTGDILVRSTGSKEVKAVYTRYNNRRKRWNYSR